MKKIGIVGRPNVGKSTLFNRLIGSHRAIVTEVAGTTRDILYEKKNLNGKEVIFLDTPGLSPEEEFSQVKDIINQADALIFVVDWQTGLNAMDEKIASLIHKAWKKDATLLVVNKLDGKNFSKFNMLSWEFFGLGFWEVKPLSLKTGEGLEAVRQWVTHQLPQQEETSYDNLQEDTIPLAIMGRPNVGKSTLFNRLIGENIALVSEQAGTTLDYNTWEINFKGQKFQLFDLMGVRRKGKISGLEKIALHKLEKMLGYVKPVVVIVVDLLEGITHRDLTLIDEVFNKYKLPVVIALNKSDEFKGDVKSKLKELGRFREIIPIVSISGKTGKNLHKLLEEAKRVYSKFHTHIPTSELNKLVKHKYLVSPPTFPKNKIVKIGYLTQINVAPPTFKVFVNRKDWVTIAFKRWLEKILRESYDLRGVPIVMEFENK